MTITEFLLERIAEDEAVAREVAERVDPDRKGTVYYEDTDGSAASAYFDVDYSQGGYTITAARVLAECESKRRMIDLSTSLCWGNEDDASGDVLAILALPYASHPDYRAWWAK